VRSARLTKISWRPEVTLKNPSAWMGQNQATLWLCGVQLSTDIGLSAFYFRASSQLHANLTRKRVELTKYPNFRSGTRIAVLRLSQQSPDENETRFLDYTFSKTQGFSRGMLKNRRPQICPRCEGGIIRRSHRKNLAEKARSLLFLRPYRCVGCHYRFWGYWVPWKLSFLIHQHSANNPNKITSARDH